MLGLRNIQLLQKAVIGLLFMVLSLVWVQNVDGAAQKRKKTGRARKPPPAPTIANFKKKVADLDNGAILRTASWGISVRDLLTGEELITHESDKSLVPASTMKLMTTGAALGILGADFKFQTHVYYQGILETDGTLNGNIYIKGSGDPTLGSFRFAKDPRYPDINQLMQRWVQKILALGIKKVKGSIIADGRVFEVNTIPGGWEWADVGQYYGAAPFGLNINENFYKLFFKLGKVKEQAQIEKIEPNIPGLSFVNTVTFDSPDSGDNAYIYGGPFVFKKYVSGTIPATNSKYFIKGSIPDAPLLCSQMLSENLKIAGVEIGNGATTADYTDAFLIGPALKTTPIDTVFSPPLSEIIGIVNGQSVNLYAECVLNAIGLKLAGKGHFSKGVPAVKEFWSKLGLDPASWEMQDGSGLSVSNFISPTKMTEALKIASSQAWYPTFRNSLAVAGVSGTMREMCRNTPAQGIVIGKSGTLRSVVCYSGYYTGKNGRTYAYSMMSNKYRTNYKAMRKIFEGLLNDLAVMEN